VFYGNVAPLDTVAPKAAVGCARVTSGPLVKESASDGHVVLGNVGWIADEDDATIEEAGTI
jgi:hypothetical protein